jgi:hypothetical protein
MRERRGLPIFLSALLLLVAAGLVGPVTAGPYLPRLLFLSGLLLLLASVITGFRPLLAFTRRMAEVAEPGPFVAWVLVGSVLVVLAIGFTIQTVRIDLTARGLNRLSPATTKALARGGAPVEMVAVYRGDEPQGAQAQDLLRLYGAAGTGIRTSALDPERNPEEARKQGIDFLNAVLVRADTVREVVSELTEAALSAAILRVRDPARPVLALLDGHGELAPGRGGVTQLRKLVGYSGIELRVLRLAETGEVPPDVRGVLVAGPTVPLLPGEVAALARFLDRGGRLGVFVEPNQPTGLEETLAMPGFVIDGRRISDDGARARSLGLGPETIPTQSFGDHEITRGLSLGVVLRGATRAGLAAKVWAGSRGANLLYAASSARLLDLAGSGPRSSRADPPAAGPMPMAAALEWDPPGDTAPPVASGALRERKHCRVVVVGDSDFLRDDGIGLVGNRAFAGRVAGWLAERAFALDFPVPDEGGTPLLLGLAGFRLIGFILLLLLPGGMLGLGVVTWLRRR